MNSLIAQYVSLLTVTKQQPSSLILDSGADQDRGITLTTYASPEAD